MRVKNSSNHARCETNKEPGFVSGLFSCQNICILLFMTFTLYRKLIGMPGQYELNLDVATVAPDQKRRRRVRKPVNAETDQTNRRIRLSYRNRALIARYYYWTEIRRRRFDDVIRILSEQEFFVEDRTISNTLLDLDDYLNELYKNKKEARELKREFPSWCWDTNN